MIVAIVALTLINIALMVDKYLTTREFNRRQEEFVMALLSRNINEYNSGKAVNKTAPAPISEQPDFVPLEQADDELFNQFIQQSNGPKTNP